MGPFSFAASRAAWSEKWSPKTLITVYFVVFEWLDFPVLVTALVIKTEMRFA